MKKTALFVAMASAATFAQAETVEIKVPTFYGKFNVSQEFEQIENGESFSELNSNASRLGLKGDMAINDDITAIYQAEYQIDVDGDGDAFKMRNTFVGAKGDFGKVQAGFFDTALKASQKKVDVFGDLEGDIKNYVTNSENRVTDVVRYQSPSLSGLVLTFDHINGDAEGEANAQSMSAAFTQDQVYVAAAYDIDVEGTGVDVVRVVGQFNLDGVQLGALWESEDDNGTSADGFMVSAKAKVSSNVTLKGQFAASDIKAEDTTQITLGADYKLAKKAKAFVYATDVDVDGVAGGQKFGAGVEYKF